MAGPRSYSAGTKSALAVLSRGTCYFPGCGTPIVEFIEGEPFMNCEIAHIRDARPGNRYAKEMSDDDRRAFANLVLLCKPHHTLIDRARPRKFRTGDLERWKRDRERGEIDELIGLRGLTEARLEELIREAIASRPPVPERLVDVQLSAGPLLGTGVIASPLEGFTKILDLNPALKGGESVIVVTARNQGQLQATVTQFNLWFGLGDALAGVLMASDQYPFLNPKLPETLGIGESSSFLFDMRQVRAILRKMISERRAVSDIRGQTVLGTGEEIHSNPVGIEHLPFWDDPAVFTAIVGEMRKAQHA